MESAFDLVRELAIGGRGQGQWQGLQVQQGAEQQLEPGQELREGHAEQAKEVNAKKDYYIGDCPKITQVHGSDEELQVQCWQRLAAVPPFPVLIPMEREQCLEQERQLVRSHT